MLLSERQAVAAAVAAAASQHIPMRTRASWNLDARLGARDATILGRG